MGRMGPDGDNMSTIREFQELYRNMLDRLGSAIRKDEDATCPPLDIILTPRSIAHLFLLKVIFLYFSAGRILEIREHGMRLAVDGPSLIHHLLNHVNDGPGDFLEIFQSIVKLPSSPDGNLILDGKQISSKVVIPGFPATFFLECRIYITDESFSWRELLAGLDDFKWCLSSDDHGNQKNSLTIRMLDHMHAIYMEHGGKIRSSRGTVVASRKKVKGSYATPSFMATYLAREALNHAIAVLERDGDQMLILDPACGSGALLHAAWDVVFDKMLTMGSITNLQDAWKIKCKIAGGMVRGIDESWIAVAFARVRAWLWILSGMDPEGGDEFLTCSLPSLTNIITRGNVLLEIPQDEGNACGTQDSPSIIIANPPWSSKLQVKGGMDPSNITNILSKLVDAPVNCNNVNIASLFVAWANSQHPRINHILLPKQFIKNSEYTQFRKLIKNGIAQITDWGKFPGVISECVSILWNSETNHDGSTGRAIKALYYTKKAGIIEHPDGFNASCIDGRFDYIINPAITDERFALLQLIHENGSPLMELPLNEKPDIERGIELGISTTIIQCPTAGCNLLFKGSRKYYSSVGVVSCPHCGVAVSGNACFPLTMDHKNKIHNARVIAGRHVQEWRVDGEMFMPSCLPGISELEAKESVFKGKSPWCRILVKRIKDTLCGALAGSSGIQRALNTVYILDFPDPFTAGSVLFQLNSPVLRFYYEMLYVAGMNLSQQVTKEWLAKKLPFVNAGKELGAIGIILHFLSSQASGEASMAPGTVIPVQDIIERFLLAGEAMLLSTQFSLPFPAIKKLSHELLTASENIMKGDASQCMKQVNALSEAIHEDRRIQAEMDNIWAHPMVKVIHAWKNSK
ncbi:hypothetical protein GF325_09290 [Candidatus Bathyarchaeota archaeon]|nr:hypothetical protein [Candidatus Bathyarchaeota archaeon]